MTESFLDRLDEIEGITAEQLRALNSTSLAVETIDTVIHLRKRLAEVTEIKAIIRDWSDNAAERLKDAEGFHKQAMELEGRIKGLENEMMVI